MSSFHATVVTPGVAPLRGPILIIGGSGMLGRAWRELAVRHGLSHEAPSHAQIDITDPRQVRNHLTERFGLVINCAAYTNVDGAEADPQAANRLNGDAVSHLAGRCAELGIPFVHYSTDYLFEGRDTPIRVDQPRQPINVYGRSKALGEEAIENSGAEYLLVRTSWLYAPWGRNFVRTIAQLAQEKPSLRVVDDQHGRPTSAEHLAAATLALLERGARGAFHVTDGGACSWYEFAGEIVRLTGAPCRVEPCTTNEFPRPAKRPGYSVLDLSAAESLLGPMPHWKDNLADVIHRPHTPQPACTTR